MKRKERPLLQVADRKLRRNLLLIAIAFGGLALTLIVARNQAEAMVGIEVYKLLLQFFLITAGGGGVLAIISNARDESSRRQERAASIREMHRELDTAYRALKKTKRRLRAHCGSSSTESRPPDGDVGGPAAHRIPRAVFERAMDDLLEAQLALETICDHIGQRNDILYPDRLLRMKEPLHYAARYFHDVHEDFEKGRVRLEAGHYVLRDAANLNDYLRSSREEPAGRPALVKKKLGELKKPKPTARRDALEASADTPEARADALEARTGALTKIIAASPKDRVDGKTGTKPSIVRYADVAAACFDLLSDELTEARDKLLS
jgi:hypothetical protein